MKYFIPFAKILMVIIWGLLIANLVFPFPGKAAMAFYFLLAFVVVMHAIQLLVIYGAFAEKLNLSKKEGIELFFFGVFKMWQIKDRLI
jgi:putative membrane protein